MRLEQRKQIEVSNLGAETALLAKEVLEGSKLVEQQQVEVSILT